FAPRARTRTAFLLERPPRRCQSHLSRWVSLEVSGGLAHVFPDPCPFPGPRRDRRDSRIAGSGSAQIHQLPELVAAEIFDVAPAAPWNAGVCSCESRERTP